MKTVIILTLGISGSGKSTWIKTLSPKEYYIISPDEIRKELTGDVSDKSKDKEVYEEVDRRTEEAIPHHKFIVIDSTNLQCERRRKFINRFSPHAELKYKLFELNPEEAKRRIKSDIASGIDRSHVPDSTIDRHVILYKQMLEDIKQEPITEY